LANEKAKMAKYDFGIGSIGSWAAGMTVIDDNSLC